MKSDSQVSEDDNGKKNKKIKLTPKKDKRKHDDKKCNSLNGDGNKETNKTHAKDENIVQTPLPSTATCNDNLSSPSNKQLKIRKNKAPKDVNAPKQPLTGYVRYLNEHRERVKEANPNSSFADTTKILAAEWSALNSEEKQKYLDEALKDKERYQKELESYQKTEAYRLYLEKKKESQEKSKLNIQQSTSASFVDNHNEQNTTGRGKRDTGNTNDHLLSSNGQQPSTCTSSLSSFEIPIFTEEFLDHNKVRETELRHLRKLNTEYEEQNAILSKHIENMKSAIEKLEYEITQQKSQNSSLFQHLNSFRNILVTNLSTIHVPGINEQPTIDNIDTYIQKLTTKFNKDKSSNKENDLLLEKIQTIISHIEHNFQ